ncbi:MAG: AAA family ATPase [Pyrobaculum sp.]
MAIAVAGLPGAGKTTVAKLIEARGYSYYNLGDVVRRESEILGTPPDRTAVVLRLGYGKRAIVKKILETMRPGRVVVDGVRSIEEVEALEEALGSIFLIYVVASRKTRYMRLLSRGRTDDPLTYSQFYMRDLREMRFGLAELLARADYIIVNEERPIEELEKEVAKLV